MFEKESRRYHGIRHDMPDRDKSKDTDENGRVIYRILFGASAIKNDRGELVINDSYTIYNNGNEEDDEQLERLMLAKLKRKYPSGSTNDLGKRKRPEIECFKCRGYGHFANDCKQSIKCYSCGKFGHYKNECRKQDSSIRA